jgi:phosphoglycolate phosphatase-like HAD superfamily hydrolase
VLFDLDGTLVASEPGTPSAGLIAMNRAAERLTGRPSLGDPAEFAGRTDVQISYMLLVAGGVREPRPEQAMELVRNYVEELEREITTRPYFALGDPGAAVRALEEIGAVVGVGTGNVPRGAALKLASAGIDHLFALDRGGYGDDGHDRSEVLARGAERCDPARALPIVIVGDTPRDVAAARAIGARCIGVPFLQNSAERLIEAGADAIVRAVGAELAPIVQRFLVYPI